MSRLISVPVDQPTSPVQLHPNGCVTIKGYD